MISTFSALRNDCGQHNPCTVQGIGKITKNFKVTGNVKDVFRPEHHCSVRIAKDIASVRESMADNPNLKTTHHCQQLFQYWGLLWHILYKVQLTE